MERGAWEMIETCLNVGSKKLILTMHKFSSQFLNNSAPDSCEDNASAIWLWNWKYRLRFTIFIKMLFRASLISSRLFFLKLNGMFELP